MRKVSFIAGILLCLMLAACSSEPKLKPIPRNGIILAFGDSLTYGTGTSPINNYPNVLTRLSKHRVINAGVPGDTTRQALIRLPALLNKYKPALVIVCLGGNDLLRKVPKQQIEDNLYNIVALIKKHNSQVLLLAVPQPKLTLSIPDFYSEVAKEQDVPLLEDLLRDLFKQRNMKSDTIHFNAQGYRKMAEGIYIALRKYGALS